MKQYLLPALLLVVAPAAAQTVHSLGDIAATPMAPAARSLFDEQMSGKSAPNPLGTELPAGLGAGQITALLLAPGGLGTVNGVGAKPWPQQPGFAVAMVCTGGSPPGGTVDTPCNQSSADDPPLQATLGLLALNPGAAPTLAAKPAVVDGSVDWRHTDLPCAPDALDDAKGDTIRPTAYATLDLAPYRIAPDQPAFGIRGRWSDAYSGGFGAYEALYLFAVVDGALRQILAVPMIAVKMTAGDWNKDGTRGHDVTSGANVLVVSSHITAGHFDLVLRSRAGGAGRTYSWSAASGRYVPAR